MTCEEAVSREDVLSYIVDGYRGEDYIRDYYNPDCYMSYDPMQAVIYQQVPEVTDEAIEKYGYMSVPSIYGLMDDEVLEESGVYKVRRLPGYDLYGQGTLIGYVDTGIDYTHPAFIQADGTTRILSIWDQTQGLGQGPEAYPYGKVYTRNDIDAALATENPLASLPSRDDIGHGTFLAGVAAGDTDSQEHVSGVAPLADLVVVKCREVKEVYRKYYGIPTDVPAYQEDDIMAGVSYLLQVAQREARPIAICIGMGTSMCDHRGGSPLSVFVNRYATVSDVVIVSSAGNEGNARHHHHILSDEDTINIDVEGSLEGFMGQLWWRTPGSLTFDIVSPSGDALTGVRAVPGTSMEHVFVPERTTVKIICDVTREQSREHVVVFRFISPRSGIWKIKTYFTGDDPDFHMWLPIHAFLPSDVYFLQPSPETTICGPADASHIITATAYDAREYSLYMQASRGYSASLVIKPDVAAPGVDVLGPYPKGRYGKMSGTSVAASVTAGICSLLMQEYREYHLNTLAVRELLLRGAISRGGTTPNPEWGYGIVDMYQSLL